MSTITLPKAGKNITCGTVLQWRKKTGDSVAKGDILAQIETDEGIVELESAIAGKLEQILAPAGKTVAVDAPLAVISGEASDAKCSATEGKAESKPQPAQPAGPSGNVTPILMPKAGQSMEEGVLVKWHVKVGDRIEKGQIIFEIETDKATMEVEATDAGRVAKIILDEGGMTKVLEPVAYLAENEADVEAFFTSQGSGFEVQGSGEANRIDAKPLAVEPIASGPAVTTESGRVKASPAARKVAAERGIDLSALGMGSGPGGRIISTDVPAKAPDKPAAATAAPAAFSPTPLPAAPISGEVTRKRMSQMRKAIARNLLASKQNIPHFYLKLTVNADPLYSFYQGEKAKYPCSLNDVIVMAAARAIIEFPAMRSRIEGDEIITFPSANIGIAVGMDDGLVVPVVLGADKLSLQQIGAEVKRIAANARGGKIEGMGQGVFTITNLGMFGTDEFSAIVNPPEAAILAVGAVREEVIVSGGTMRPGRVMTMTISADHRIVDGMLAAKFMARMKQLLEWPGQMVL